MGGLPAQQALSMVTIRARRSAATTQFCLHHSLLQNRLARTALSAHSRREWTLIPCTTTNAGLHEFVASNVLAKYAKEDLCAVDLGSGPGAMASRLHALGCKVLAVDRTDDGFVAGLPHVAIDFDRNDFALRLGPGSFDIVTAIEVIEHVESPIGFLRNVRSLLAPGGVAIITTPNVDCLPARVKFFLTGRIRTMDEFGEPTHISPIFWDLLRRQFLPRTGLNVRQHLVFPPRNYRLSRKLVAWTFRIASTFISNQCIFGDNHVLVLEVGKIQDH